MYEGYYKDGLASGHGVRKSGSFKLNNGSVYIGEWANGLRQGYGVMDDISKGSTCTDSAISPNINYFTK